LRNYIEARVSDVAFYMLSSGATLRTTAKKFGVSKSTIHKDMTDRLFEIDPFRYEKVNEVLMFNKSQRAIRGGQATKLRHANDINFS